MEIDLTLESDEELSLQQEQPGMGAQPVHAFWRESVGFFHHAYSLACTGHKRRYYIASGTLLVCITALHWVRCLHLQHAAVGSQSPASPLWQGC